MSKKKQYTHIHNVPCLIIILAISLASTWTYLTRFFSCSWIDSEISWRIFLLSRCCKGSSFFLFLFWFPRPSLHSPFSHDDSIINDDAMMMMLMMILSFLSCLSGYLSSSNVSEEKWERVIASFSVFRWSSNWLCSFSRRCVDSLV